MKKWCKVLAALMLVVSILTPLPVQAASCDEKIAVLKDAGIISGYPDGSLGLEKPISRAEVSVLLIRMTGNFAEGSGPQVFNDVSSRHWASGYIYAACQMKNRGGVPMIVGYPDGSFGPGNPISNAEIMKIFVVAAKAGLSQADVAGATWPTSWIGWADELGIVGSGSGIGSLSPQMPATRGDVFVMLYNAAQSTMPTGETGKFRPVPKPPKPAKPGKLKKVPNNPAPAFNSGQLIDHRVFQKEFLSLVNYDRARMGLEPLQWDGNLSKGTVMRSQELADYGDTGVNGKTHVRVDGRSWETAFDYLGPDFYSKPRGENLMNLFYTHNRGYMLRECQWYLQDPVALAQRLYIEWWNSTGHRANMMNPNYRYINVQVRVSPKIRFYNEKGIDTVNITGVTTFRG